MGDAARSWRRRTPGLPRVEGGRHGLRRGPRRSTREAVGAHARRGRHHRGRLLRNDPRARCAPERALLAGAVRSPDARARLPSPCCGAQRAACCARCRGRWSPSSASASTPRARSAACRRRCATGDYDHAGGRGGGSAGARRRADLLDVNVGLPEMDERAATLRRGRRSLQGVTTLPLAD